MKRSLKNKKKSKSGALFKDFILGGQDGLVEVLGLSLGLGVVTQDPRLVVIAGLAATFSESISMGAVAYTSSKAEGDYYESQKKKFSYLVSPIKSAFVVLIASIIGSLIPLSPFFFVNSSFSIVSAMWLAVILAAITLFVVGALEAKFTVGSWLRKGFTMVIIGLGAAFIGFLIGKLSGYHP